LTKLFIRIFLITCLFLVSLGIFAYPSITVSMDKYIGEPGSGPYTVYLTYKNDTNRKVNQIRITDYLPYDFNYVPNSGRWNLAAGSFNESNGNNNQLTASTGTSVNYTISWYWDTLTIKIGNIPPGEVGVISYKVYVSSWAWWGEHIYNDTVYTVNNGHNQDTNYYNFLVGTPTPTISFDATGATVSSAVQGSVVSFNNTITNTGTNSDSYSIKINSTTTTFPSGTTFKLFYSDGVTLLPDTNGDGKFDTSTFAKDSTFNYVLKAYLPSTYYGTGPFNVGLTIASKTTTSITKDISDILNTITRSPDTFTATGATVTTAVQASTVSFANTIANTGLNSDSYSININSSTSTFPSGTTFKLFYSDGATLITDTNSDGKFDTTVVNSGSTLNYVLKAYLPSNYYGTGPFNVGLTIASKTTTSVTHNISDILNTITRSPDTFTATGNTVTTAVQNTTVTFANTIVNTGINSDSYSININSSTSTFPSGTTYRLFYSDGVTLITDTNSDGKFDTTVVNSGSTLNYVLKAYLPSTYYGTGPFNVSLTITSKTTTSVTHNISDILNTITRASDTFTATGATVTTAVQGSTVSFANTIANTGLNSDSYSININSSISTFPSGTTFKLFYSDGVTLITDTNSDGQFDTTVVNSGSTLNYVLKAYLPSTYYGTGPFNVSLTITSKTTTSVTQTVSDILNTITNVPATFTATGATVTTAVQGSTVSFINTIKNTGINSDSYSIKINSSTSTFPSGTIFKLFYSDGVTLLPDTNGDGQFDTTVTGSNATFTYILKAYLPTTYYGTGPFNVSLTITSKTTTSVTQTISDILNNITRSSDTFTATGANASNATQGSTVSFNNTIKNTGYNNDSYSIAINSGSNTFPSGTTFELFYSDGVTAITDTNSDGKFDTTIVNSGNTLNYILKAYLPINYYGNGTFTVTLTITSKTTTSVTRTVSDVLTGIVIIPATFTADGDTVDTAVQNTTVSFNNIITNTSVNSDSYLIKINSSSNTFPSGTTFKLFYSDGVTLLPDVNSDGQFETTVLNSNNTFNYVLKAYLPVTYHGSGPFNIGLTVTSSSNNILTSDVSDILNSIDLAPATFTATGVTVASVDQGGVVSFSNTITNTGINDDSYSININSSSSTFPSGTTYKLFYSDGVTPLPDTNSDGEFDTTVTNSNGTFSYVLKAYLPATYYGSGPFNVSLTITSKTTTSVTETIADILNNIIITPATFTATGNSVSNAAQGSVVLFNNTITNTGINSDSYSININSSSSTFPSGTTFELFYSDGVTPLPDTNSDGQFDSTVIGSNSTFNYVLKAYLPDDYYSSYTFNVDLTITSKTTSSAIQTISDILNGIDIAPATFTVTGATVTTAGQGSVVSFSNSIKNTSMNADNYTILINTSTSTFPSGTTYKVFLSDGVTLITDTNADGKFDTAAVLRGATYNYILKAYLPASYHGTGPFTVSVTIGSKNVTTSTQTASDVLNNITGGYVSVTDSNGNKDNTNLLNTQVKSGKPGEKVTFNLKIKNDSQMSDIYSLTCNLIKAGYVVNIKDASNGAIVSTTSLIGVGVEKLIDVEVTIPENAPLETLNFSFRAASSVSLLSDYINLRLIVLTRRYVVISPNNTGTIRPNGTIIYDHTVTNNGNAPETDLYISLNSSIITYSTILYIDSNNNGVWDSTDSMVEDIGVLNPNQSRHVFLMVIAPPNVIEGNQHVAELEVLSSGFGENPSGVLVATDITTINSSYLYLELYQRLNTSNIYTTSLIQGKPGNIIDYKLVVTNRGIDTISTAKINMVIPDNTTALVGAANEVVMSRGNIQVIGSAPMSYDITNITPGEVIEFTYSVKVNE